MVTRLLAGVLALLLLLTGCAAPQSDSLAADPLDIVEPEDAATMTIAEVLRADGRFSRFTAILERVDTPVASSTLDVFDFDAARLGDDREGVTLFVPTDTAFEALDPAVVAVLEDPDVDNDLIYSFFGHHYVPRLYPSEDFEAGPQSTWRRSPSGKVELNLDPLTFGRQPVEETDLRTANGYIHVLGGVIIPDTVAEAATR